jgi:hypothetical protein
MIAHRFQCMADEGQLAELPEGYRAATLTDRWRTTSSSASRVDCPHGHSASNQMSGGIEDVAQAGSHLDE